MIRYLDIALLAGQLGTTQHKVRMLRSQGLLPAPDVMPGTRPLWQVETIDFWMRQHPITPSLK